MTQAPQKLRKLSRPQSSTVEPFTWRRWTYDFFKTSQGEYSAWTPDGSEPEWTEAHFKQHHKEAATFWGHFGEKYDAREAYERGLRRHDPLLAPHGFFRSLAHGNNAHAREFLEKFGPLRLPSGASIHTPHWRVPPEGSSDIPSITNQLDIDLTQFWCFHRRFCIVAQLWEAAGNRESLVAAWRDVERHREEASRFGDLGLGESFCGPLLPPGSHFQMQWPWLAKKSFENWLGQTPTSELRKHALWIVGSELILHTRGSQIYWEAGWEPTKTKFRQVVIAHDLWSVIWEFLGWDTARGSWRRCPHCHRFFYPKRRDQFYCSPRQQALASKREYARRVRAGKSKSKRRGK